MEISRLYVALSRATSLTGLYLLGRAFRPPKRPTPYDPAMQEMIRLERESLLIPKFQMLREVTAEFIQIISHNIQSVRKHIATINADKIYTNSDLILLQETWARDGEFYNIDGFEELTRNEWSSRPKANGTMIYSKTNFGHVRVLEPLAIESENKHIEVTMIECDNFTVLNIYKNPSASLDMFKECLEKLRDVLMNSNNIILAGDLNNDLSKSSGLEEYLDIEFGLKLISPRLPTTNAKTVIDGVFGRFQSVQCEISLYESYFSFHKPLIIRITKN